MRKALGVYKKMVRYCLKNNIKPIITLHHFTRPQWFDSNYGGLHSKVFVHHFSRYVETVCKKFGIYVRYWITFNEPMLECVHGYLRGTRLQERKAILKTCILLLKILLMDIVLHMRL